MRPLPYISNAHLVCMIASLPRSGLAQATLLHLCLDNRCRTLGTSMRQFGGSVAPAWLSQSTVNGHS